MEEKSKDLYIKCTQQVYQMSFKLSVVQEIECGELPINGSLREYGIQSHSTVFNWCRKFGNFE